MSAVDRHDTIIDVRSPAEFAEDHMPGAINCPVLDNEERARVGTLHKQVGAFEARRLGGALAARNIGRHIEQYFAERPRDWAPLVYCWRGGQRSRSFTHVLREIGWRAGQLEGGYRAYRRQVIDDLERLPSTLEFRVVCGRTGCGKSRLLGALAALGAQVLDLEQLAAHRGSVLGDLPDSPQPTQRAFESALWSALRALRAGQPVFVEAESKRIGALHVPDALMARMRAAPTLRLEASVADRTALLIDEYHHLIEDPQRLLAQLECLRGLHSTETLTRWRELCNRGAWPELVTDLLTLHYDPAYERSMFRNYVTQPEAVAVTLADTTHEALVEAARGALAATIGTAKVAA